MSNTVIRSFSEDPSAGNIVSDGNNLYFTFVLNNNSLRTKNIRYIKICVIKTKDLEYSKDTSEGFTSSYRNLVSRNDKRKLRLYKYENDSIILNINSDRTYEEYTFSKKLSDIYQVVPENIYNIYLESESPNDNILNDLLESAAHSFKVFFLDNKKNVIENYLFKQNKNVRFKDYLSEDFNDEVINFLTNSLDINFEDYSNNNERGPRIVYNPIIEDINDFNLSRLSLSITINGTNKTFTYPDIAGFSTRLLEEFRSDLIYSLYENLLDVDEDNKILSLQFSYKNDLILKEKTISKSKILSLYKSYFKKFKYNFLKYYFRNIIEVNNQLDSIRLKFNVLDKSFLLTELDESKFILSLSGTQIDKVYTTLSFNESSVILSNSNKEFSFNVFFPNENSNIFYVKKQNPNQNGIIIKFKGIQVYPLIENNLSIDDFQSNVFNSVRPNLNFGKTFKFDSFNSNSSLPDRTDRNTAFVSDDLVSQVNLSLDMPRMSLNKSKLLSKNNLLKDSGYNTDSNDYLLEDVMSNSIIKYSVNYNTSQNESYEETHYRKMSDLVDINGDIKYEFTNFSGNNKNAILKIDTITFPDGMLQKILSDSELDEDKESVAVFLNESFPRKYRKVNNIINKYLFSKSYNKSETLIFQEIFKLSSKRLEKSFILNEDLNNENENLQNTIEDNFENVGVRLSISNSNKELNNISKENFSDKRNFEFFNNFKIENNTIVIFKKKRDQLIAKFDIKGLLKDLENKNYDNLRFNISYLVTLAFDHNSINKANLKTSERVVNDSVYLDPECIFSFNNLRFKIKNDNLLIYSPHANKNHTLSNRVVDRLNNIWGDNKRLYFKNVLERFCVTVIEDNKSSNIVLINNYIKKDYSLEETISNKTYLLDENTKISNLKLYYK